MVKINLGSGPSGVSGWRNFDWGLLPMIGKYNLLSIFVRLGLLKESYLVKWPEIELVDIRKKLPLDNKSVNFVYCSHVLEHFEREETAAILKEVKRILKKNGRIRIVLPDLEKIYKKYINSEKINDVLAGYPKSEYSGMLGNIKRHFVRPHLWMYTYSTFKKMLQESGFKNIKKSAFKKGDFPDIDKLDLDIHEDLSFYVEAGN